MIVDRTGKVMASCSDLCGREALRFDLMDWLESKRLTVEAALELLDITKREISKAAGKQLL